jgi:hypothetical protein
VRFYLNSFLILAFCSALSLSPCFAAPTLEGTTCNLREVLHTISPQAKRVAPVLEELEWHEGRTADGRFKSISKVTYGPDHEMLINGLRPKSGQYAFIINDDYEMYATATGGHPTLTLPTDRKPIIAGTIHISADRGPIAYITNASGTWRQLPPDFMKGLNFYFDLHSVRSPRLVLFTYDHAGTPQFYRVEKKLVLDPMSASEIVPKQSGALK